MNSTESFNVPDLSPKELFLRETMAHWMFKAGTDIDEWWFLILVPIGFIGNVLSFASQYVKSFRVQSITRNVSPN